MTLKPCPNPACRSTNVRLGDFPKRHVYCTAQNCWLSGPDNDPTGDLWNNLLRVEDVEAALKEGYGMGDSTGGTEEDAWDFSVSKRDLDRRMGK